ncbi:hypothetical protein AB3S75_019384 [Citrus x aurantiifolia]
MVVTTHFIDNSWKLYSRILRFIYVLSPHTAEAFSNELVQCLLDWNVDRKLSSMTLDNCTTNDAMVEKLLLRFLSPHCSRLHPNTLESLVCAQKWIWASYRGGVPKNEIFAGEELISYDDDDDGAQSLSCLT